MSIHVLIAGLPRLLAEVVSAGFRQSENLTLVNVTNEHVRAGSDELHAAITTHSPDAAIVGMTTFESEAIERTQLCHTDLAILALAPDGTQAWDLKLRTELRPIAETSPSAIRHALETAVSDRRCNE